MAGHYAVVHYINEGQEFDGGPSPKSGWAWSLTEDPNAADLGCGDGPFDTQEAAVADAKETLLEGGDDPENVIIREQPE